MKLAQIVARKQELLALSALQREAVALNAKALEPGFHRVDQALAVAHFVRKHWVGVAALAGLAALRPPRKLASVVARGWAMWRTVQAVLALFHRDDGPSRAKQRYRFLH